MSAEIHHEEWVAKAAPADSPVTPPPGHRPKAAQSFDEQFMALIKTRTGIVLSPKVQAAVDALRIAPGLTVYACGVDQFHYLRPMGSDLALVLREVVDYFDDLHHPQSLATRSSGSEIQTEQAKKP